MTRSLVETETTKSARVLTLHRPERRNALSAALIAECVGRLEEADRDEEIRGVIIAGDGPAFSAGADLPEALAADSIPDTLRYLSGLRTLTDTIERLSKPVVAAIHGSCRTGGVELALACDRRIATRDATFAVTSSRIGSVAGLGGTQRLPRLVGPAAAKDLLMTGRVIDADRAAAIGLVDDVVDEGRSGAAAIEWVEEVAASAPIAVWLAKSAVNVGANTDLATALEYERLLTTVAFTTHDRREGMSAVLEKRPPRFTGR